MAQTIFNILDDFDALWSLLEEQGGDISNPDVEKAFSDFTAELRANFRDKADSYARVISDATAKAEAQKDEAKRILALAKSNENKAIKLKSLMKMAMEQLGLSKLETEFHKFSIQQNGGKRALDIIVPIEQLPIKYRTEKREWIVNSDILRTDLESGVEVDGVTLFERGDSLHIR